MAAPWVDKMSSCRTVAVGNVAGVALWEREDEAARQVWQTAYTHLGVPAYLPSDTLSYIDRLSI